MGTNLLLLSTAPGAGIAVNSKTKKETFVKMMSAGAGLGVGVIGNPDYRPDRGSQEANQNRRIGPAKTSP